MTLRLYSATVRSDGDQCDKCDKRIQGGDKCVIRSDGLLFCDRACADAAELDAAIVPKAVRLACL